MRGKKILSKKDYGYADMVRLSFKTSPFYTLVLAAQKIFDALLPTASIFITASFIDNALAVYGGGAALSAVYTPVALLAAIMVYNALVRVLNNVITCRQTILYRGRLVPELLEKWASLEYRHIENPKTADLIDRVCPEFDKNVREMYSRVLEIFFLIVYIAGILGALASQVWWVGLTMLAVSGPVLCIATVAGKRTYDARKETSKIERRYKYLSGVIKSREAVEERGVYGYTEDLNARYAEQYESARKYRLKVDAVNYVKVKMGGIITSLYSIGAMLALLSPVTDGELDYGMFIGLMGAVFDLSGRLAWGVNHHIEDLARRREYLKDLTEFMRLEERPGATEAPRKNVAFKRLEFKNVSFKYPGTDKLILDDVSFVIESGKHYSFVGVNGAGKTTVTKLITGLYTDYEGDILVDGRELRTFDQSELKGLSSVVYQDFARYCISLYDNIALGGGGAKEVADAAAMVGLSEAIDKLPEGMDTALGKIQENGADLSGGEWQRAAMARCVVSAAPLKILDEPTAALDPIGESTVYKNFERISKGTTTIFISHRLGSTKLADTIFVLSGGKIAERGSHTQLMAENGVHAEMFNTQAEWYTESEAV